MPLLPILQLTQPSQLTTIAYQPNIYDGAFSNCLARILTADPAEYASITASYTGGLDFAGKKKQNLLPAHFEPHPNRAALTPAPHKQGESVVSVARLAHTLTFMMILLPSGGPWSKIGTRQRPDLDHFVTYSCGCGTSAYTQEPIQPAD